MSLPGIFQKCRRNWLIVTGLAGGLATLLLLYTTAKPVWKELRPWLTQEDAAGIILEFRTRTNVLAERIYPRTVEDQTLRVAVVRGRIKWLEARYEALDENQHRELDSFRLQLIRAEADLTRISQERALFQVQVEHR